MPGKVLRKSDVRVGASQRYVIHRKPQQSAIGGRDDEQIDFLFSCIRRSPSTALLPTKITQLRSTSWLETRGEFLDLFTEPGEQHVPLVYRFAVAMTVYSPASFPTHLHRRGLCLQSLILLILLNQQNPPAMYYSSHPGTYNLLLRLRLRVGSDGV